MHKGERRDEDDRSCRISRSVNSAKLFLLRVTLCTWYVVVDVVTYDNIARSLLRASTKKFLRVGCIKIGCEM